MNKGPSDGTHQDQPGEMTETEKRQLILSAYKKLKTSFEKFKKPNGDKDNPAKTCKDLYVAYPDLESGKDKCFFQNEHDHINETNHFQENIGSILMKVMSVMLC